MKNDDYPTGEFSFKFYSLFFKMYAERWVTRLGNCFHLSVFEKFAPLGCNSPIFLGNFPTEKMCLGKFEKKMGWATC
jgi:hypothetical protein